ncbi:MAG TPA: amino acid permease [Williamwhitmania sp.]|nr:amino acid permease [Williamwhitmania sp.]
MEKFDSEVRLAREMTTLDATLIGVGAMIGAGIFVLIGIAAGVAGPGLLLTFILNGFIALLTAMSYAELGSCYHDAGGGYLWVKEGLPKWNGFVSGWMSWFAHAVACSLYALGFGAYFEHLLGEFSVTIPYWGFFSPQKILAAGTTILFAYVNFRGASETGKIGNLITLTKIVILLIFIGFGLELIFRQGDWMTTFSPFLPHGYGGVFKSMGLTFIAFQGFEVIAQSSEEIKNPRRNIPRAVFFSLIIVVPIYILVAFVAIGTVKSGSMTPWDYLAKQKEIALVEVAKNFFVGGGVMLLIGGLISTISALNATIYSSSRVAFAMGRDRNFPSFFSKVHPKNHTPHWSILVSLFIIIIMAVSLPIEDVASAADIMFLLLFLQVNIAMIRLRKKRPDLDRGFFVPLFPYLSILGILLLLFLAIYMFNYSITAWIVTIIWVAMGLSVFKFYAADREVEHVRKVSTLARISKQDYTILVCLSKTDNIKSMCQIAFAVAKKHQAKLVFLHVIELGENKKLQLEQPETAWAKQMLQEAQLLADEASIPSRSLVKISHRISEGIVDTSMEENCNFIMTGRNKVGDFASRFFSSAIDNVLQKTTNEVAILHGDIKPEKVKRILIPYSGDIHTRLAIEISPALSDYFNAAVTIGVVVSPETPAAERQLLVEGIKNNLAELKYSAEIETVVDTDILHGILGLSKKSDLLVMGGKSGDFIELLFAKSLTREITEQAPCPVLWLKEFEERESFLSSMFKSKK